MKPRGLLAAVIVLAALGGALYWSNRKQKAEAAKPATDTTTTTKILSIPEDQIKEVTLKKTGAETTVLRKGDDGKWQLAEPKPLRADQDTAKSLVASLATLNADKVVEDKAADLSPYGLNAPTLDVTVLKKDGKSQDFLVGDDTPTGGGTYAKLAGDPHVYTIASYVKTSLDKTPNDLRDKRLLTFDQDKLTRVDLQPAKGETIEFGEIIFVAGATEAINLVAQTYGRKHVGAGDEVLITAMEHHSNIVPWQILCEEKGAHLKVAPIDDRGELLLDEFAKLIGPRTKIVAVTQVSNALGTVLPLREMIELAHRRGVPVLVDGAQAVPHFAVDVQALDCDFYAYSGHKVYGPTGIGVLYGKRALLDAMPPYQGGGDMIRSVTFEKTTYNDLPWKFEAGTPDIAGAIALGAALNYITGLGMDNIAAHENDLLLYATEAVGAIPEIGRA